MRWGGVTSRLPFYPLPPSSPTRELPKPAFCRKFGVGSRKTIRAEPVALVCFDGCRCIKREDTSTWKVFQQICLREKEKKKTQTKQRTEHMTSYDRLRCTDVVLSQLFQQAVVVELRCNILRRGKMTPIMYSTAIPPFLHALVLGTYCAGLLHHMSWDIKSCIRLNTEKHANK